MNANKLRLGEHYEIQLEIDGDYYGTTYKSKSDTLHGWKSTMRKARREYPDTRYRLVIIGIVNIVQGSGKDMR